MLLWKSKLVDPCSLKIKCQNNTAQKSAWQKPLFCTIIEKGKAAPCKRMGTHINLFGSWPVYNHQEGTVSGKMSNSCIGKLPWSLSIMFFTLYFAEQQKSHRNWWRRWAVWEKVQEVWEGWMFGYLSSLFCKCIWKVEHFAVFTTHELLLILFYSGFFLDDIDCNWVSSGVRKMDTRLAGIICHVVSIFATNVLITTTEGNVGKYSSLNKNCNRLLESSLIFRFCFFVQWQPQRWLWDLRIVEKSVDH